MAIDHPRNEARDGVITEAQSAVSPFQRGGGKETAVEKGDGTEPTSVRGSLVDWCVEGAEEQGPEQAVMELAA